MASRSAVMISGERSANCASSFLRKAGASWAAAALRWMTRPARSSSTAGSGMPATTAATAAASTGLTPRTSSREVTAWRSRQGTSAAAMMQPNTAAARSGDNSSKTTSTASATLSHIDRIARGARLQAKRGRLTQALRPGAEDNLAKRQQHYRYDKRRNIIEQAEQQHAGEQFLAVHLPEADQHGGVEHAKPSRRMAGEAQERR